MTLNANISLSPGIPYGRGSVVEIGANSLKFHGVQSGYIHTVKYPYDLGHEVYATGNMSRRTVRKVVDIVRGHGVPEVAIATSAVRDAENSGILVRRLREEFDLELHVLSCFEESSLLAKAYMERSKRLPAMAADIGSGSVEVVFVSRTKNLLWDSLPVGVIRLYHKWKADGLSGVNDWIDGHLLKASIVMADEVFATGGIVKTMARTLRKTTLSYTDVAELERRVWRDGPPSGLKAQRARVFFPGILLIRKLLEFLRAERLHYFDMSVGRRLLGERLGRPVPSVRSRYFASSNISRS